MTTVKKKPTNWWGSQNAALIKFDTKPSDAAFWTDHDDNDNAGAQWSSHKGKTAVDVIKFKSLVDINKVCQVKKI